MKHVHCFSGGHASALAAIECFNKFGRDEMILLNHDINPSVEDRDIKRFKIEIADYLKLPITFANMPGWAEKDQFDVCMDASAFKVGNGTALCTNRLKTKPFEAWLAKEFPDKACICYYGFEPHEGRRIHRRLAHLAAMGYATAFPLANWERTILSTVEIGVRPPSTYSVFKHANCVGCLKAGRQHWYVVYCTRPDIFAKAKFSEDFIGYTIINGISMAELEPLFERMKLAGIPATEKIQSGKFWTMVRKAGISLEQDVDLKPCECAV